jgi:alkylhydroperoxidase/carboxymuconolactone decarboxylase family protein YurZ
MAHLAVNEPLDGKSVEWMEKVSDEQYLAPVRGAGGSAPIEAQTVVKQNQPSETGTLSTKQQRIVAISAFTANGDLTKLRKALNDGLDSGLTVNEVREVLVHLYAYAGFPRSLQGINTLISVVGERTKKGIKDVVGREASPITATGTKYERGKRNLEKLTGRPEPQQKTGYAAFAPEIEIFLKEHLFADIFDRDVLTFTDREIVTISALIALGGVEPMMQSHMTLGLNVGLSESGLRQILAVIESDVGKKEADAGRNVLSRVIAARKG